MIENQREYHEWIQQRGVGENDKVASSPDSYVSYLNGVSDLLGVDISARTLASEEDVLNIARTLEGKRAPGTIRNYKSAMRQYVAMVGTRGPFTSVVSEPAETRKVVAVVPAPAKQIVVATEHNLFSSYREMLLEYLFSAEVMRHLWLRGNVRMETLKPQVDDFGYDLVLEANGVVRHVQLKSSHVGSSTADVKVSLSLARKPSGCVIWLWFDPATLVLGPFLWFGAAPGMHLPDISGFKVAKHSKGNAQGVKLERANVRVVPKQQFETVSSILELVAKLFGPPREGTAA
jgi:hypothetical protein